MPLPLHPAPIFRFRDEQERAALLRWRGALRATNTPLVFTNGVFDLLHRGHVTYLLSARNEGAALLVGVNADASVKRLKGDSRPIQSEEDRALILASLGSCDAVVIFDQDTPKELIDFVIPDVLVKGGDYKIKDIVGRDTVESNGGVVKTIQFVEGKSTTGIVERMKG
jgi:D-glycero-beta-D-manno-heptose 1-phosphate adenylyltransferase